DGAVLKIHVFVAENTPKNLWSTYIKSAFLLCRRLLRRSGSRRADHFVEDQPGGSASGRNSGGSQISPARTKGAGDWGSKLDCNRHRGSLLCGYRADHQTQTGYKGESASAELSQHTAIHVVSPLHTPCGFALSS